jgi:hypothetical protein
VVLQEVGEDLVFALQLGFELPDLLFLGVLCELGLAAVLEGQVSVLEQQPLPGVKARGIDIHLITERENGRALQSGAA